MIWRARLTHLTISPKLAYNKVMIIEKLKLDNPRTKKLLLSIIGGVPMRSAFRMNSLSDAFYFKAKKTYENYLKEYQAGLNKGEELEGRNISIKDDGKIAISGIPSIVAFYGACLQCSSLCLESYIKALKEEKGSNWNKWAWLLERQFKEEFSKEIIKEDAPTNVEAIKIIFSNPKDQASRLEALTKQVREAIIDDKRIA